MNVIQNIDHQLALFFHGGDHAFYDAWAVLLTNTLTWVPLFICLLILVVKNNEKPSQMLAILIAVAVGALLSSGLDNLVIKPLVARPRPFMDPLLADVITPIRGYTAPGYSFFSAHASNTVALAVFASLLIRYRTFTLMMTLWALVNCWTRLYLGVHFASDVLVGALWGLIVGHAAFFLVYKPLYRRVSTKLHFISSAYTKMGYAYSDIDTANCVMALTYAVTMIIACATALDRI